MPSPTAPQPLRATSMRRVGIADSRIPACSNRNALVLKPRANNPDCSFVENRSIEDVTEMADDDDRPIELPIVRKGSKKRRTNEETSDPTTHEGPRDPRFDPRCSGSNEVRHFVRNYSFLNDVKQKELDELQRSLRREKDPEKKDKIKMTMTRYRNKMIDWQQKGKFNAKKTRGSKQKKQELMDKFKDLKESGKLTKYLERKRKKLMKRDEKLLA